MIGTAEAIARKMLQRKVDVPARLEEIAPEIARHLGELSRKSLQATVYAKTNPRQTGLLMRSETARAEGVMIYLRNTAPYVWYRLAYKGGTRTQRGNWHKKSLGKGGGRRYARDRRREAVKRGLL